MSNATLWQKFCEYYFQVHVELKTSTPALSRSLAVVRSRAHHTAATVYSTYNAELQRKLANTEKALEDAQLQASELTSMRLVDAPFLQDRERLFHSMVQAKLHQSGNIITAQGIRGRPITLMKVTSAERRSDEAGERTKQLRSQLLEQAGQVVSGSKSSRSSAIVVQQANLIRRNCSTFLTAANEAGLKTFGSFAVKDIAALSAEMPLSTIAVLKRMFRVSFGCDPFSSLDMIRHQRAELSFKFECGSYQDSTGNKVHFLRVTDVDTVLMKTLAELNSSGRLEHLTCFKPDELRLFIPVDKGGCSTKLVLQVLNCSNRHSTSTARLLAFFRGGEDTYENITAVFSPVIDAIYTRAKSITALSLPMPPLPPPSSPPCTAKKHHHRTASAMKRSEKLGATPSLKKNTICTERKHRCSTASKLKRLEKLDATVPVQNTTISPVCSLCAKQKVQPQEETKTNTEEQTRIVQSCTVVAGGDWLSEATLLGLTGPKGRHFCNFCLATLSELKRGKPHAPVVLPRYNKHGISNHVFELRTFESLQADSKAFSAAG